MLGAPVCVSLTLALIEVGREVHHFALHLVCGLEDPDLGCEGSLGHHHVDHGITQVAGVGRSGRGGAGVGFRSGFGGNREQSGGGNPCGGLVSSPAVQP